MENKNLSAKTDRPRLNVIDILIIFVALLAIVGLIIRFGNVGSMTSGKDLESYDIYFSVENIAYTSEDAFVAGDAVTLADSGVVLGTFVALESILPAEFLARDLNGDPIVVNYPEATQIDVTGHIASEGRMTDNGYLAGGTTYVASGASYAVQTEHMDFVLRITNIVEK